MYIPKVFDVQTRGVHMIIRLEWWNKLESMVWLATYRGKFLVGNINWVTEKKSQLGRIQVYFGGKNLKFKKKNWKALLFSRIVILNRNY